MDSPETPARKKRRDRFVKVAERRTTRVLKEISMLSNCSNRNAYSYEEVDVEKIFSAIEAELKQARARFSKAERSKEVLFRLSE